MQLKQRAAFAQLEKRNLGLEDTIEGMSNEFVKFGERAVAWEFKEQVLQDVKETTSKFLDMAKEAERINQGPESAAEEISPSKFEEGGDIHASPFSNVLSRTEIPKPSVPTDYNSLFNLSLPNLERVNDTFPLGSSGGQFSPRLGFGLANTSIASWSPENPWDQYYISGPKSFALHLYIDSVNLIVSVLRGELNFPSFIPSTARYYLRHGSPDRLVMLITLMVEKLTILDGEEDKMNDERIAMFSAVDYRLINEVVLAVVREVYREEGELRDWLDPWGVQTHLMERWKVRFAGNVARFGISTGGLGTIDPRLLTQLSNVSTPDLFYAATKFSNLNVHRRLMSQPSPMSMSIPRP